MAKKIKLQHLYTQTGNTAPTGNDALGYGEFAIAHKTGEEAIFIKNNENGEEVKFIPKKQIEQLINVAVTGLATDDRISALTTDLNTHKNLTGSTADMGHVKLVGGDLSGKTGNVINGEAAASNHIHSQYFAKDDISNGLEKWQKTDGAKEMLRVKAADNGGITVDTSGVSINSTLKNKWNAAADAINAFLEDAKLTGNTVDTLKEIQQFLDGTGSTVQTLLDNLSDLTDTVSGNTSDIGSLKDAQSNYATSITSVTENIGVFKDSTNRYTIYHTSASTQNSAITAANTSTGLNFGDSFQFVDNIGYDANGHVVSGSTHELKLPVLTLKGGLTGVTGTTNEGVKGYQIGHENSFQSWNGKSTGITLNYNESFKIPIIDYKEQDGRDPDLSGVDTNGHLKNNGWTLTTFSLPSLPYANGTEYGIVRVLGGDLGASNLPNYSLGTNEANSTVAHYKHTHSQYASSSDLGMTVKYGITTISCGTY